MYTYIYWAAPIKQALIPIKIKFSLPKFRKNFFSRPGESVATHDLINSRRLTWLAPATNKKEATVKMARPPSDIVYRRIEISSDNSQQHHQPYPQPQQQQYPTSQQQQIPQQPAQQRLTTMQGRVQTNLTPLPLAQGISPTGLLLMNTR